MTRYADWPKRLVAYLAAIRHTPHSWGRHDCCTFSADGVIATTGEDPMAPLRNQYSTQLSAARLIAEAGSLQALVTRYMGQPMSTPALAGRGDVVLFEMVEPYGPQALGICVGAHLAAPGPAGMVLFPITVASAAWRV